MRIKIADIVKDPTLHVRAGIDEEVVRDYAERMAAGDSFPAVVVFQESEIYRLADGFHRTAAALRAGREDIEAEVRQGTAQEALWFAVGANRTNGVRMTPADLRHAILLARRAFPDYSQNMIAERVGCSRSYVEKIVAEQQNAEPQVPHVDTSVTLPERVTGKDGKSYPASRRRPAGPAGSGRSKRRRRHPLSELKKHWQLASPEDRREFIAWVDQQERDLAAASDLGSDPGLDAIDVGPETDSAS
jgi:ParB-like chromosome segregation protein Spo0J